MSKFTIADLEQRVKDRAKASADVSYTRKLLDSVPDMAVGWLDGIVAGRAA